MGSIKGKLSNLNPTVKDVTTTEGGNKTGLDVSVLGGNLSEGTGTGLELEGSNALASGSILYGLEWKRVIKQTSPSDQDIYNIYSDSAGTNLISILTIIYETNAKDIIIDAYREDK